jgi:hypothetical protein
MNKPTITDPRSLLRSLTEEDVRRALDELAREEKVLRGFLRSIRRAKRGDIRAKGFPPIAEVSRA